MGNNSSIHVNSSSSKGFSTFSSSSMTNSTSSQSSTHTDKANDSKLPNLTILKDSSSQTIASSVLMSLYCYVTGKDETDIYIKRGRNRMKSSRSSGSSTAITTINISLYLIYLLIAYFIGIYIVMKSPYIQTNLTYLHNVNPGAAYTGDLTDLKRITLSGIARNINVTTTDGILLHGWHVLPGRRNDNAYAYQSNDNSNATIDAYFDAQLASASRIIVYFHGNSGNRGLDYRVDIIKAMAIDFNAHVITVDYRGFGDNGGAPSEVGTGLDAIAVMRWIDDILIKQYRKKDVHSHQHTCKANKHHLYLYGHSLGSAVSVAVAAEINSRQSSTASYHRPISGVILDAPFVTFPEAAKAHPMGAPFRIFPYISDIVASSLIIKYPTIDKIDTINTNLLLVHCKTDSKVPIRFSSQLYDKVKNTDMSNRYKVGFLQTDQCDHNDVYKSLDWVVEMNKFMLDVELNDSHICL